MNRLKQILSLIKTKRTISAMVIAFLTVINSQLDPPMFEVDTLNNIAAWVVALIAGSHLPSPKKADDS